MHISSYSGLYWIAAYSVIASGFILWIHCKKKQWKKDYPPVSQDELEWCDSKGYWHTVKAPEDPEHPTSLDVQIALVLVERRLMEEKNAHRVQLG